MVKLFRSTQDLIDSRSLETRKVGFVPTMGNLHSGHISLLDRALEENDVIYFSIFVNPKQFGPNDDFQKYPRTLEQDLNFIRDCAAKYPGKEIFVYAPAESAEVFPENSNQTVSVMGLSQIVEGSKRPGHFDGVTTVVYRLFELTKPHRAYFGLKDYQQYIVIRQMVRDLQLPINVIGMPIVREMSGLALSSRNQYLSPEQKQEALILPQALRKIESLLAGRRANLALANRQIQALLLDPRWNYLEMKDAENLSDEIATSKTITLLGVFQLGSTRLLDNLQLELE